MKWRPVRAVRLTEWLPATARASAFYYLSVRLAILVPEAPRAALKVSLNIIVRVEHAITGRAITDLKIDDNLAAAVYELMTTALPGLKAGTHTWPQLGLAGLGYQGGGTFKDVDELVLPGVGMAKSRYGAPGTIRVRFTPKLDSPKTSPSWRFTLPAICEANGSG